jgi:hypothetical protein
MATLTLKQHSVDIQKELEELAAKKMLEESDIPYLIKTIVLYALENQDQFTITGKLSYQARDFNKEESNKVYSFEVAQEVKQKLINWAKDRIDGKVKELQLKQVKFILLVYFAKGLSESTLQA